MGNEKSKGGGGGGGGGVKLPPVLGGKKGPSVGELVERAQRTGVLQASNAGLKDLPPQMAQLASRLRNLDLASNRITAIPPFIGDFITLKQLHLDNNRLTELPDEMGQMKKLEILTLNGNQLTSIPDALISCTALKTVSLAGNALRVFPPPLAHVPALEMADLSSNHLTALPDIVADCRAVELNLNRNQIASLNAAALSRTPRLKRVEDLEVLRVEENCLGIGEVSEEFLRGSKVSVLAVAGNLFQEKDLHHQAGWEAFQERETESRKKLY